MGGNLRAFCKTLKEEGKARVYTFCSEFKTGRVGFLGGYFFLLMLLLVETTPNFVAKFFTKISFSGYSSGEAL